MKKIIAPSILSCDFARMHQEIEAIEQAGADWLHIDVMDGRFVPNITIGPVVIEKIRSLTKLPFDVHLMIDNPENHIKAFADAGADRITVHVEAMQHHDKVVRQIKELGKKVGVALNPATPLFSLDYLYEYLDLILLMTVNPGFGGQKLIEGSYQKIKVMKKKLERHGFSIPIQVDGGVNLQNIGALAEAGADILVAGSAIFGTDDYAKVIKAMRAEITAKDA